MFRKGRFPVFGAMIPKRESGCRSGTANSCHIGANESGNGAGIGSGKLPRTDPLQDMERGRGMNQRRRSVVEDRDAERLRRLRMNELLRDLVRQEGRLEAAELLGVNYKTLARAIESGRITGRMNDALESFLGSVNSDGEVRRQGERIGELEARMERLEGGFETLARELRDGLGEVRDAVAGKAVPEEVDDGRLQAQDGEGAELSETVDAPPVAGLRPEKRGSLRRLDPEIVTEEPAGDDAEVYGAAWPLVEEWRRLRAGHPDQGRSLSWLTTEERLLTLELAMLEEHGLTLPPEKQPLRGFGRRGQTNWRRTALGDTKKALLRRELLRWARRILTLGLWWK